MASRFVLARAVTIPAGTAIATPATTDISIPQYVVDTIQIIVPPGPNGLVGFRMLNAGQQLIPYLSNDWIVANNENIIWPLSDQITSGSWQVAGYNLGIYDHSLRVRFLVSPVPAGGAAGVTVSVSDLSTVPGVELGGGGVDLSQPPPGGAEVPLAPPPELVLTNPPPSIGAPPPPPPGPVPL